MDWTERTFYCSFEDIGTVIIAVVDNEQNSSEVEAKSFGPIRLDPRTKSEIEGMVISERGKFEV